jgi:hypothetical protein
MPWSTDLSDRSPKSPTRAALQRNATGAKTEYKYALSIGPPPSPPFFKFVIAIHSPKDMRVFAQFGLLAMCCAFVRASTLRLTYEFQSTAKVTAVALRDAQHAITSPKGAYS